MNSISNDFNESYNHHRLNNDEEDILNYVWINKEPFDPMPSGVSCGIPLHYIDRALENASLYPDVSTNIWIDFRYLDLTSIHIVKAHILTHMPHSNVRIQDLSQLKNYCHSRYRDERADIWNRVDFARFVVVKHCLDMTQAKRVFYSDFDCENVSLNSTKLSQALQQYDLAFAEQDNVKMPSHAFIGTQRSGRSQSVIEKIIQEMNDAFETGIPASTVFEQTLGNLYKNQPCALRNLKAVKLPDVKEVFSPNPKYVDCGLNDPSQCTR